VIERRPMGKAKVVAREEIKTGILDTHAKARAQLDSQTTLLDEGATGKKVIRLELDGRDITGELDLQSDITATKSTRGPAGKRFDKSLGVGGNDLEQLCNELLAEQLAAKAEK